MRSIILAAALVALAPAAIAQTYNPTTTPPPPPSGTTYSPNGSSPPVSAHEPAMQSQSPMQAQPPMQGQQVSQPDPNNCGTPDEPKACPPMPRRALNQYPANK